MLSSLFLLCGVAPFVISVAVTGAIRAYAVRRNTLLDLPNSRSSHTTPTPRGGGAGIVAASVLGLAGSAAFAISDARASITIAIGVLLLGTIGWIDDTRGLGTRVRFAIHIVVAIGTVIAFGGLPALDIGTGVLRLGPAGYVLAVLGIVWSINLFNFMDGIDGLAGSQAVLIFAGGALLLAWRGHLPLAATCLVLGASSAGFLTWNWPPARIFMGDCGSGSIGYALAAAAVYAENTRALPLLTFATLGGFFIGDATVTLIRRWRRGARPTEAHRSHAYQRLTRHLGSHRPVTLIGVALTCVLGEIAAVGATRPSLLLPSVLVAALVMAAALLIVERRAPM